MIRLGLFLLLFMSWARAQDEIPDQAFDANRYEKLWKKSPFAVETPESTQASVDYALVGIARMDGIDYASVVSKQTNDRFFISTDKPEKGIALVSVSRTGKESSAVIQANGQMLTLKMEATITAGPGTPDQPGANLPPVTANAPPASPTALQTQPPPARRRAPIIRVPSAP